MEKFNIPEEKTNKIIPFLRIYISAGFENHDMAETDEVIGFLHSENRTITEVIKDLLDKGMFNVYACSFNQSKKVI